MPGSIFSGDDHPVMAAQSLNRQQQQPPPVAPRSGRPANWTPSTSLPAVPPSGDECVHARSGSMDSLESSGSSGSSCSAGRQDVVPEYVPARAPYKAPKAPSNALQFVKVQSPLYKKAEQQIKLTKEVKITREALKEGEEEWQSNLDNWKSRRRKVSEKVIQRAEEMRQIEVEEQIRQEQIQQQQRKIKKFSEIVEKRSAKRTYNFDLYVGQGDDSGLGGTPEPEDQDGASDGHNSALRSDTSEGMTSEAESVDSDIHRSDKTGEKEPPKVPRKPHPWTSKRSIINDILEATHTIAEELLDRSLTNKDLSLSDNISSTEPSDIEGHAGDTETVSSEEDISYCGQVGNVDSGLESLGDFHRPSDIGDSASDFSQDSCSGLEKNNHCIDTDFHSIDEHEDNKSQNMEPLKEVKDSDGWKCSFKIAVKPGDNRGFGFALKGGKDQACAAYVDCVTKDGAADIAGLKIGDKVLLLNGEETSVCSHASLVFTIKQAIHTGMLDIVVLRSSNQDDCLIQEKPKPMKKGSSFAEKLALFSNGVNTASQNPKQTSPNYTSSQKLVKPEESKTESLVLRRRSTFENGNAESSEFKSRRSSYISQSSSNTSLSNGEKRYSADWTTLHNPLPDSGVNKKSRPPPVPVKPKLKLKPNQSEQHEVSSTREKFKLNKQKTFDLEPFYNEFVENVSAVCESPQQRGDEVTSPPPLFSNEDVVDDLKVQTLEDDLRGNEENTYENKIINSIESVLASFPQNTDISESNVLNFQNPTDFFSSTITEDEPSLDTQSDVLCDNEMVPDLELIPNEMVPVLELIPNEMVPVLEQESKSSSINPELSDSSNINDDYKNTFTLNFESEDIIPNYDNYSEFYENEPTSPKGIIPNYQENPSDFYKNDATSPKEIIPNYQENYSDFYKNEPISPKDIDLPNESIEAYNIVCDDEPINSVNANVLQSSPDSNTYSDNDSNTIDINADNFQNSSTEKLLVNRTEETEELVISEDVNNDFESHLEENVCEKEITPDLETMYSSELPDINSCMKINLSPLCLPLEKIDEDDVISASTATSSDSPNTETVIETMPSNISPLPNDELNGETYLPNAQEPDPDVDLPPQVYSTLPSEEISQQTPCAPIERVEEYDYNYQQNYEERQEDSEYSREFDESLDQITSLDVIDEMELRLMQQLEQQGDTSFEDMPGDLNEQLGEVVDRQWLYLTEEAALLDDLAPKNLEPPREPPPPPPPPDVDILDKNAHCFARANSTKRIKKELWRRRSDFLGLDSPEGIDMDNIPPRPPGLEEILKQEREQTQWLEKRLSLAEVDYSLPIDVMEPVSISSTNTYSEYMPDYFLQETELNCEDDQNEDYIENLDEDISYEDSAFNLPYEDLNEVTSNTAENVKPSESPQHKAKQHIQSLGAAPKAKIMDSNKWITQAEKKFAAMQQKTIDPVFSHGSYNQNYWLAQEGERRRLHSADNPAERRFSMPPTYSNNHPDVTVRTWGDREYEFQQQRPRSEFWNKKTVGEDPYLSMKQDVLRTRSLDSHPEAYNSSDTLESEVHKCSCCGKGLCEGSAMGIEALQLYFHIECFRCCMCHIPLGNGSCGTDVQVKNNQLYCPSCFTVD